MTKSFTYADWSHPTLLSNECNFSSFASLSIQISGPVTSLLVMASIPNTHTGKKAIEHCKEEFSTDKIVRTVRRNNDRVHQDMVRSRSKEFCSPTWFEFIDDSNMQPLQYLFYQHKCRPRYYPYTRIYLISFYFKWWLQSNVIHSSADFHIHLHR